MKTKIRLLGLVAVLVALVLIGSTFANNTFVESPRLGTLDISTMRLGIGEVASFTHGEYLMPGGTVNLPENITVVHNGADYAFYARATIYKFWADGLDENLDPSLIHLYVNGKELKENTLLENGWWVWHVDEEQIILYYTRPVLQGEQTARVMDSLKLGTTISNDHQDKSIHVEILADAVQAVEAASAMEATWGIAPEFDGAGYITALTQDGERRTRGQ